MELKARNAPEAYEDIIWRMRTSAVKQDSRNGEVLRLPEPFMLHIERPEERLITDYIRDANPFFHCMEFIWMMAGSDDAKWLAQFNARYMDYAEENGKVWGAYGYRWRRQFGVGNDSRPGCQITKAVEMLRNNPDDRRVVLQMWDTYFDLGENKKDLPCNTQIMLEVQAGHVNMLVTNRSNDVIWGMLGANIVHMTMLQELIAEACDYDIGRYSVISNNAHIYTGMPRFKEIYGSCPTDNIYPQSMFTLLHMDETLQDFFSDCENLVERGSCIFKTRWMANVGYPIYRMYIDRKSGITQPIDSIAADDWRIACQKWLSLRGSHG